MNTLLLSLLMTFTLTPGDSTTDRSDKQSGRRDRPTKLAHFQMSTYISAGGKLNINVNKELGGQVNLQLADAAGKLYFEKIMQERDTTARFRLDVSDLKDGDYIIKVSNGLEVELREIKLLTPKPTPITRTLTVL
ncbi:hypothetical protein IC229_14800 [Spirosoma sp. BT702]|uniref:Uncharacterized protein n=1 Tax=Spirosoma profusum TaxID=2771354 RepID=A0A926Y3H9_9BACT|nr:hypothetical protein [Spirosoma profusum]MBD2701915.1 hypothetical protein [Spirosoma profusum]